jgi:hypothetical protein
MSTDLVFDEEKKPQEERQKKKTTNLIIAVHLMIGMMAE